MKMTAKDIARFCGKINTPERGKSYVPRDVCWEWNGAKTKSGYGTFFLKVDGKKTMQRAHRISWMIENGRVPHGIVCHTCDNRACVNPDHLFIGTPSENSADMVKKGRSQRGEDHTQSKLTRDQVVEIRMRSGDPPRDIAKDFGVSARTVRNILHRDTWAHI